jgi:hypothetical protein
VLGLPPAFNLSHDQTLQFNFFCRTDTNGCNLNLAQILMNVFFKYELYESLAFDNFAFAKLSRKCPHALLDLAVKEPARAAPQTVGCELYTSFQALQEQYFNLYQSKQDACTYT